jgi:site-specific DNA-methyltransferase (adenine-specific)
MDYKGYKEKYENNIRCQIKIYQMDCKELLKQTPDKYYSLCIVDPPYGIGVNKGGFALAGGGKFKGGNFNVSAKKYKGGEWDSKRPEKEYFQQLLRVSKNQIIWGGNYFADLLSSSNCWIVWDKDNGESYQSDCELAWTSFESAVRKFCFRWWGLLQGDMKNKEERIHPTQKPVALYRWLLQNYAKKGDKILDTHLGSMSSVIACYDEKFDITGAELDPDYFKAGMERVNKHTSQVRLDDII